VGKVRQDNRISIKISSGDHHFPQMLSLAWFCWSVLMEKLICGSGYDQHLLQAAMSASPLKDDTFLISFD
jgi:hypothetical protein